MYWWTNVNIFIEQWSFSYVHIKCAYKVMCGIMGNLNQLQNGNSFAVLLSRGYDMRFYLIAIPFNVIGFYFYLFIYLPDDSWCYGVFWVFIVSFFLGKVYSEIFFQVFHPFNLIYFNSYWRTLTCIFVHSLVHEFLPCSLF